MSIYLESAVTKAIKKALADANRGHHDLTIEDLILVEQIKKELEARDLLKPKRCHCKRKGGTR